jgi:hypothetical protein
MTGLANQASLVSVTLSAQTLIPGFDRLRSIFGPRRESNLQDAKLSDAVQAPLTRQLMRGDCCVLEIAKECTEGAITEEPDARLGQTLLHGFFV